MKEKFYYVDEQVFLNEQSQVYDYFYKIYNTLKECCEQFGEGEDKTISFAIDEYFKETHFSLLDRDGSYYFKTMRIDSREELILTLFNDDCEIEIEFEELNFDILITEELIRFVFDNYKLE